MISLIKEIVLSSDSLYLEFSDIMLLMNNEVADWVLKYEQQKC